MKDNPAYMTSFPFGFLRLVDFSPITSPESPVFIWGYVDSLPTSNNFHAFTINEYAWDGQDCATAGAHLSQAPGQSHGWMNWPISHTGDLIPVESDATGYDWYSNLPGSYKASMYNPGSIIGLSLVIYEF